MIVKSTILPRLFCPGAAGASSWARALFFPRADDLSSRTSLLLFVVAVTPAAPSEAIAITAAVFTCKVVPKTVAFSTPSIGCCGWESTIFALACSPSISLVVEEGVAVGAALASIPDRSMPLCGSSLACICRDAILAIACV